jgi:hypothetical protein
MSETIFQQLEAARSLLSDPIQQYSEGCVALNALTKAPRTSMALKHHNDLRGLVLSAEKELQSLELLESRLRELKLSLTMVKNEAFNALAPIHTLHPEILAHVFAMVLEYDGSALRSEIFQERSIDCLPREITQRQVQSTAILASTCRYWRSVAMGNGSLWVYCYIDLSKLLVSWQGAQAWLDRTRASPLELVLRATTCDKAPPISDTAMRQAIRLLCPDSNPVRSMDLCLESTDHLNSLLRSWFDKNVAETLTDFSIWIRDPAGDFSVLWAWLPRCRALQTLDINGCTLDFGLYPKLPGLVDLRLSCLPGSIKIDQFAKWLHASPRLQRLELYEVKIQPPSHGEFFPIVLDELRHAIFDVVTSKSLCALLSSLSSKSTSTSLYINNIDPHLSDELVEVIKDLSRRSTITALGLGCVGPCKAFILRDIICSLPQLTCLSLIAFPLSDEIFDALSVLRPITQSTLQDYLTGAGDARRLDTLFFESCYITNKKAFQRLIEHRSIKKIRLIDCTLASGVKLVEDRGFCNRLLDTVSDFQIASYDDYCGLVYFK